MNDKETYTHSWKCSNCKTSNVAEIPKGITVASGDLKCGNCGCTEEQIWKELFT